MGRVRRGLIATVVATVGFTAVAPAAQAGTVRVTGTIVGAGGMFSTEGGPYNCHSTTASTTTRSSCGQGVFSAAFEAWVWLRAQPSTFPAGNWEFVRWGAATPRGPPASASSAPSTPARSPPTTATRSPSSATSGRRDDARQRARCSDHQPRFTAFFGFPDPLATFRCAIDTGRSSPAVRHSAHVADGPHSSASLPSTLPATRAPVRRELGGRPAAAADDDQRPGTQRGERDVRLRRERARDVPVHARQRGVRAVHDRQAVTVQALDPTTDRLAAVGSPSPPTEPHVAGNDGLNVGPIVSRSWTVDSVAPTTTFTAGPTEGSRSRANVEFSFGADEDATFRCALDSTTNYSECTSPHAVSELSDGPHVLRVKADDGLREGPVVSRSWTVDTVAPTTTFTAGPAEGSRSGSQSAQFSFMASRGGDV